MTLKDTYAQVISGVTWYYVFHDIRMHFGMATMLAVAGFALVACALAVATDVWWRTRR